MTTIAIKSKTSALFLALLCGTMMMASTAQAGPRDHNRGDSNRGQQTYDMNPRYAETHHDRGWHKKRWDHHDNRAPSWSRISYRTSSDWINRRDAEILVDYMAWDAPPFNHSYPDICRYRIGYPLSRHVNAYDLPRHISWKLSPPRGTYYVQVDRDILLVSEATHKVIDAITLLSMANR